MKREIFNIDQGTDEWRQLRLGRVTASKMSTVMAKGKGGSASKTRKDYMYKLAGERITGEFAESYSNGNMDRGHVMEEEARSLYCFAEGVEVEQVGFIAYGDDIGCSPDGLVDKDGMWEAKSRLPHILLELHMGGAIPRADLMQCHSGLWIADREWIDYMAYWPGMVPFQKRIYRDGKQIAEIQMATNEFLEELHEVMNKYKTLGG